jgi:hypothetical protein
MEGGDGEESSLNERREKKRDREVGGRLFAHFYLYNFSNFSRIYIHTHTHTALHGNMSLKDLAEVDFCYAPPYSSANDPLNLVAFVGMNDCSGTCM